MKEMLLIQKEISPDIKIPYDKYLTLVIENKDLLFKYLMSIKLSIEENYEDDDSFVLFVNDYPSSIYKYSAAVLDLLTIDFNSKAIMTLVTKKLKLFLNKDESLIKKSQIESLLNDICSDFVFSSDFDLNYDIDFTENIFAKIANFKFDFDDLSLLERLCKYVDIMAELMPLKLFIIAFAKEFFADEQLDLLFKHCADKMCRLLLIENSNKAESLHESVYIIDNDLCCVAQP